jgi:carboxymethylenebutenolidase
VYVSPTERSIAWFHALLVEGEVEELEDDPLVPLEVRHVASVPSRRLSRVTTKGASVSERDLRIETSDGAMTTFVAHPDEGGPFPVVLIYMDALGLRDELRGIGRRVAGEGYYVVVPDLFYRFGEGITFDAQILRDPESGEMERMFALVHRMRDDEVMADTRAVLDAVGGDPLVSGGPKGAIGFCLGGRLVVRALTTFPDELAAGAALHPSFIVREDDPDSAHLAIGRMRGELYVGLGGADQFQPPAAFEPARAELERHGIPYLAEVHDGADHGYMIPGAPAFHEEASERSWERTLDLFRRTLQQAAVPA